MKAKIVKVTLARAQDCTLVIFIRPENPHVYQATSASTVRLSQLVQRNRDKLEVIPYLLGDNSYVGWSAMEKHDNP